MKASHYINEVKKSKAFKDFIKEDPKAYLCSLFFMIDFNERNREVHVDFYSPKEKKIISFDVSRGVERIPLGKKAETITHKKFIPKPLSENVKMDVDALKPTLVDEMRNRDMTYEIEKILAFLNVADDRVMWNCTGFLKGLGLLQAHVEDSSSSVLFMDKKSLFDMIKFAGNTPEMSLLGSPQPAGNVVVLNPENLPSGKETKPKENIENKKKESKPK